MSSPQAVSPARIATLEERIRSLEQQVDAARLHDVAKCSHEYGLVLERQNRQLRTLEASVVELRNFVAASQSTQSGLSNSVGMQTHREPMCALGEVELTATTTRNSQLMIQTCSEHTDAPRDLGFTSMATRKQILVGPDITSFDAQFGKPPMERKLQASIWEVILLVNLRPVGLYKSCLLVFGLAANICIQALFCYFIGRNFLYSKLPNPEDIRRWRLIDAHDRRYLDVGTGSSLVSRVCINDASLSVARNQQKLVRDIAKYMNNSAGLTLFLLSMSVWFLKVSKEVQSIFGFLLSLMGIPRGSLASLTDTTCRGTLTSLDSNMQYGVWQISAGRVLSMFSISLVRFLIIVSLMLTGTFWLADTKNLEELILNALALDFLMEVPELIFDVVVDQRTKSLLDLIQPLPWPSHIFKMPILRVRELHHASILAVFVVVCTMSLQLWVLPDLAKMRELQNEACGGHLDFVVGVQSATGMVLYVNSTSPSDPKRGHSHIAQLSVASLAKNGSTSYASSIVGLPDFRNNLFQAITQVVEGWVVMQCQDVDFITPEQNDATEFYELWPMLWTLRAQSGYWHGKECSDFAFLCGRPGAKLLRLTCPHTCGCDNPLSGLVLNTQEFGCHHSTCSRAWDTITNNHECKDFELDALSKHPGWQRYIHELGYYGEGALFVKQQFRQTFFNDLQNHLRQFGCELVAAMPKIDVDLLCSGHLFASLRTFCPVACLCKESINFAAPCPKNCRSDNTHQKLPTPRS